MKFIDPHHDLWHAVTGVDGPTGRPDPRPDCVFTLEQWQASRGEWPAGLNTGVSVPNDVDIETLVPDLPKLSLVVLNFPKWTDGRAYSQAHLLRQRYGFSGQIRAIGEVVVDMAPLLARSGFDAAQLKDGEKIEFAQRALGFFDGHYQGDVAETRPWFARPHSGASA